MCWRQKPCRVGQGFSCSPMGRARQKWLVAAEKCVISCSRQGLAVPNAPLKKEKKGLGRWGSHGKGIGDLLLASRSPLRSCSVPAGQLGFLEQGCPAGDVMGAGLNVGLLKSLTSQRVASVQGEAGVGVPVRCRLEPSESVRVGSRGFPGHASGERVMADAGDKSSPSTPAPHTPAGSLPLECLLSPLQFHAC